MCRIKYSCVALGAKHKLSSARGRLCFQMRYSVIQTTLLASIPMYADAHWNVLLNIPAQMSKVCTRGGCLSFMPSPQL